MKDKVFIFLTIVLIILFAVTVLENIVALQCLDIVKHAEVRPLENDSSQDKNISEIVTRLEEVGLEPREAEYYKVVD